MTLVILLAFASTPKVWMMATGLVAAAAVANFVGLHSPAAVTRWSLGVLVIGLVAAWMVASSVSLDRWGGLLLTIVLAVAGITLSFPFGVLLALGRRSTLPAVRIVCTAYIETFRGVPLIAVLFMAAFALGFFLPPGVRAPSLVVRAIIAIVMFTASYIAEIVRGGLLAVPTGQTEAALALGLRRPTMIRRIILPQALRAVIPAIVGQFISLFKDTSLVAIIGLTELLRVAQIVTNQPDFIAKGLQTETLVFASFIYWTGAYTMSKASQRLEGRLRTEQK